jgi:hypothetical protein
VTTQLTELELLTGLIEITDAEKYEDNDDPNLRTHIIVAGDNEHIWNDKMNAQQVVDLARLTKVILTAVCGYEFIPKHNPEKYELCSKCADKWNEMAK